MANQSTQSSSASRFLKRFVLLIFGTLALLLLVRLAWGWYAMHQLNALVESYRAQGQPTLASDFDMDRPSAAEDAAPLLREAARSIRSSQEFDDAKSSGSFTNLSMVSNARKLLHQHIIANRKALELVRRCRPLSKANWTQPGSTEPYAAWWTDIQGRTALASLLEYAALDAHLQRDEAGAMDYFIDAIHASDLLAAAPVMFQWESAHMCNSCCDQIDRIAHDLHAAAAENPAFRPKAHQLITLLLDEANFLQSCRLGCFGSRSSMLDLGDGPAQSVHFYFGGVWPPVGSPTRLERSLAWLVRPAYTLSSVRSARDLTATSDAISHLTPFSFAPRTPYHEPRKLGLYVADQFAPLVAPAQPSGLLPFLQENELQRQSTATAVAIRVYQMDHQYHLPQSYSDLVPTYLPTTPAIPFKLPPGFSPQSPQTPPPVSTTRPGSRPALR